MQPAVTNHRFPTVPTAKRGRGIPKGSATTSRCPSSSPPREDLSVHRNPPQPSHTYGWPLTVALRGHHPPTCADGQPDTWDHHAWQDTGWAHQGLRVKFKMPKQKVAGHRPFPKPCTQQALHPVTAQGDTKLHQTHEAGDTTTCGHHDFKVDLHFFTSPFPPGPPHDVPASLHACQQALASMRCATDDLRVGGGAAPELEDVFRKTPGTRWALRRST